MRPHTHDPESDHLGERHHEHHGAGDGADLAEPAAWDERYASSEHVWSGQPNEQLVTEVTGLRPGRALELGAGEGADAVWLAEQGWAVTVTDFSRVGLERARQAATHTGHEGEMDFQVVDARDVTAAQLLQGAGGGKATRSGEAHGLWDLVTSFYMHLPSGAMQRLVRELVQVVAPEGTLLIVGHHPDDVAAGIRRPDPSLLLPAEQIAEAFPLEGWDVSCSKRPRRVAGPESEPITVWDSVLVAVHRG